jgi:hypothetical protein
MAAQTFPINNAGDVYQFVERLKMQCQENGQTELHKKLDDALHLGSSGLEIIGAIQQTLKNNYNVIEQLLGSEGKIAADQVIAFVDKAFGR